MIVAPTPAEALVELARRIKHPRAAIIHGCNVSPGTDLERCTLALRLAEQPPARIFQAIFEEWDFARIVRELY